MSTAITTEIARIDEYENAEASKKEEVSNHAESDPTADRADAEAPAAETATTSTSENGSATDLVDDGTEDPALAETTSTVENGADIDITDADVMNQTAVEDPDRTIAEALEADAETAPTPENGADLDATQATIDKEISVTDSSVSIMPDDDLVPPQTQPNLPDEDTPVVDPAHALILDDRAVAKSAESVFLDDASVTNSLESAMQDDTSIADSATQSWQSIQSNTKMFFENAISYTTAFFKNNRQLWTTLGVIFLAIISVKLLFAGLDALEDIPLVAPLLKIIGLVYLVRFVWRYLIRQSDRQELVEKIEHTKAEVLGN